MTLSIKAYEALRHDIIRGTLVSGQPLRMAELSTCYKMGFSPLREALNRLQSERLVVAEALRGFKVSPLSLDELQDAINTRILIESEALRSSIRNGDDTWASGIVAALYELKLQVDRTGLEFDIWELEARHHAFHRSLLSACGSLWTLEFFERLYAATERYRIPILLDNGGHGSRDIQSEHSNLADATLSRDADNAVKLLTTHYQNTAKLIQEKMLKTKDCEIA